jgi:hypothetical protein
MSETNPTNAVPPTTKDAPETAWERAVRHAVRTLRYGSVEVQVHDGRVVQVETREKLRFADERRPDARRPGPGRPDGTGE